MKKLLALTLSALFAVSAFILPNYVSGATAGDVEWVLIPENPAYPTNEYIVAGYNLGDYHYPDTDDDITGTLNSMSTKLKAAGGGTIFIPAGEYVVRGNIDLQEGVTLCGEWRAPVEGDMAASGTILKAYAGRNNPNATAFITCRPNTCVRNLTIWYPDQDPEDIVPYSDTIRLWRTGNWGADYTNVRNVTLINSYKGVVQDGGCACPNVHNLYGTTLHTGLQMDRIADIGRFDYVYLSPKYWQQSGLPGAPASGAAKTALEKHIYENAIGLNARRTDWSYWSFCYVEGYKIGLAFTECQEEGGGYCNGECYDMNFTNCQYGIYVEGISGVGQMLANINIKNCETGIYTLPDKINEYGSRKGQLNTQAGNMQFSFVSIDADTAIAHRGPERLHFLKTTIERGAVIGSWGTLTINDSDFKNDPPHIQLEKYDYEIKIDGYYEPATTTNTGGIFLGNRYKSAPALRNERLSPVQFDEEPLDIHMPDLLKPEQAAPRTAKPARAALYIVEYADITGANDATDAIQEKLDEAAADGGGIVFLPGSPITTSPGRAYRIDGSLTVPTGVELRGAVDIGRIPIKIGTIFRVYGGANQTSAPPTVILQEGAGLRGIIFDYPEQEYVNVANLKSYPYAVQGRGKDIYIVNVSIRNGYNGFDLKTYRCDNHYVEFLAGFCYKNVIQVGGGSTGGFIGNLQFNTGALLNGAESKYGTWPNSPTSANSPNYEARFLNDYTQKNMIFFETSDVVDQVLYNNFSYRGKNGFLFTAENGKAANGWFVGNAIDAAAIGLEFRAIGEMDIINPQVVSLRHGNNTVTEYYHLYTHSSFKDTVNIYNMDCWGVPAAFIRADGGVMNIYNSDYEASTQSNSFTTLGNNGRLNLVGGNTMNRSVNRLVEGAIGNISVKGFFFPVQMSNLTATNAQHWLLWRSAWNTPDNVIFDSFSTLEFVETFRDYPIRTTNGITNVPVVSGSNAGSFNAVSGASANSSVRILNEQAVLSMNEQAARAFFQSSAALMPAGLPNSQYHIELRMNIEQIRSISGDGYSEITISMVMDNVDSIDVATFLRQNFALMADEKLITGWNTNTWYRLGIDIDLRDISAKTYTVTLSDDAYNEIASSDPILFPSEFQDNAFGARGIWLDVAASAGGPAGRTTFVVDYALVTRKMVQKAPTVDRTALEALVNAVKNQANEGFTGLSWNAFTKALQTAQALLNDLGTDQAAVDAAETALESAWKALRKWGFVDTAPNKDRITVTDARLILQYLVEKIDLDPAAYAAAAVNGTVENGAPKVTINDARLVLQYLVEKIDRFPAEH